MTNVLPFRKSESTDLGQPNYLSAAQQTGAATAALQMPKAEYQPTGTQGTGRSNSAPMPVDELYRASEVMRPELATSLTLLKNGIAMLEEAMECDLEGDKIGADDSLLKLQALMPELFCCRTLGDGFGAVINAIHHALINRDGLPLNQEQIRALNRAALKARSEPFMKFDAAVDVIMEIEDAGLRVEPAGFEHLADWLDE